MLNRMKSSRTWEKIIENKEDAKKIEESFKRMVGYTKDFQVVWPSKTCGQANVISQLLLIFRIEKRLSDIVTVHYFGELISSAN